MKRHRPQVARRIRPVATLFLALSMVGVAGCGTTAIRTRPLTAYRPNVTPSSIVLPRPEVSRVSALQHGNRIHVYLRGIPSPEDLIEEVGEGGAITLPHIGPTHVAGLTPTQAERAVEKAYVEGGYYRKINVIVVAEEDEYFVRGEVKNPGRFPLTGGRTLLQAIAMSGGYTDFSKRSRVKIIRGERMLELNAEDIEQRKIRDPIIKHGDIIVVERKIFL